MDFQQIVDAFSLPTCIVSVEKKGDGGYGEICFVALNDKYKDFIADRLKRDDTAIKRDDGQLFVSGTPYHEYFPRNKSFETVCYRAAVLKDEVHTYAHINNVDIWFDIYALPIEYSEGNIMYCSYTASPGDSADKILDTVNTSQAASDVLKTCIKLHKANNLKEAMESVISDIRLICKAEGCTVLLINDDEKDYSILATDYVENSQIKRVTSFEGFYDIANSWKSMLGSEGDCIIVRDKEDMDYVSKVNNPWYLTLVEAGVKSVVLFPLRQGNELLGFIWAINFATEDTIRIKETLQLTTFFISSHIARYKVLKRLIHMGYTDTLTEIPNRFACTERVSRLIDEGRKFTAVSIDINNFKSINDTLGFEAGNRVLVEIADRWKTLSDDKMSNIITRTGGDEFFLIISGYENEEDMLGELTRYSEALNESLNIEGCDLYVTASFGYAEYPTDASTSDEILSHATAAMKKIKQANSSEHILKYTPDIIENLQILEVENLIRAAIENDTIYFNLQPQFDMNHKLRGFEALARMKDVEGNVVSPGTFIPVAEKVGLIDRVDGIVFKKATMFFGELLRKTGADLTISINASVRHMMKSDFLDEIRDILKTSGIPADKLEIEITESIMIDSVDKALRCIDELKSMGIQIAIDDFGTGYSSLSYLNRFPANLLKVDKSFIDKMNTSDSSRHYVAAIISIGHVMGFDVISEGVEEIEQLETLKEIGCDYIQGFIWGRPLSAEDSEKLVMDICR